MRNLRTLEAERKIQTAGTLDLDSEEIKKLLSHAIISIKRKKS